MAELADALDLGSSAVKGVQVQVLFPAPPNAGLPPLRPERGNAARSPGFEPEITSFLSPFPLHCLPS